MLRSKAVLLGAEANKRAESGQYYSAIELFSKAIELYPFDYRFYLNRAFCYEKSELYHMALADSEEAIRLNRNIEKCYFRKARALTGLREYTKAEDAYKQVLLMNANCFETRDDLIRMRSQALLDMGFDKPLAVKASVAYDSIRSAIDGLLSERVMTASNGLNDFGLNVSDFQNNELNDSFIALSLNNNNINDSYNQYIVSTDENAINNKNIHSFESGVRYADKARNWAQLVETQPMTTSKPLSTTILTKSSDKLLKPTNIWGYNGLRAENVNIDNKKAIMKRFGHFGKVKAAEPLKNSKSSVWVYYDNPVSPVEAIARMQGTIHSDINYYHKGQTLPIRLFFAPTDDQTELKFCRPKQPLDNKGECYYWRTTNCSLEDKCPLLHVAANKHIDAQVWMKTRDGKPI